MMTSRINLMFKGTLFMVGGVGLLSLALVGGFGPNSLKLTPFLERVAEVLTGPGLALALVVLLVVYVIPTGDIWWRDDQYAVLKNQYDKLVGLGSDPDSAWETPSNDSSGDFEGVTRQFWLINPTSGNPMIGDQGLDSQGLPIGAINVDGQP